MEKWGKSGEKLEKVGKIGEKWMTENHFRSHFSPFQVILQLSDFLQNRLWFFHSRSSMAVSNMNLIRVLVSQLRETQAFSSYFHKMAVGGHFGFPIFSKIDRVLPL